MVLSWVLVLKALIVSGCNVGEADKDEFVGTWYSLDTFSMIELAGPGRYLLSYEDKSCGYRWCPQQVREAEKHKEKLVVSGNFGVKHSWEIDPHLGTMKVPQRWEMLRVPNDWDRRAADRFFNSRERFEFYRDNPDTWQEKLTELSGR